MCECLTGTRSVGLKSDAPLAQHDHRNRPHGRHPFHLNTSVDYVTLITIIRSSSLAMSVVMHRTASAGSDSRKAAPYMLLNRVNLTNRIASIGTIKLNVVTAMNRYPT